MKFIALMSTIGYNKGSMAMERRIPTEHSPHLPPREVWQFIPGIDEKIPTPVDEYGLVDVGKLLTVVKTTIDPGFAWDPHDIPNKHHLYWEHRNYPQRPNARVNPHTFCELPSNKLLLPTKFHSWLHVVTKPPTPPDKEVMYYQIEAHRTLFTLFSNARESARISRMKGIPQKTIEAMSNRHFDSFCEGLEIAQKIPVQFQPINYGEYSIASIDDMHAIAPHLGEIAVRRTINRVRDARLPLALAGD